jgi:membrane protease YdiL (CAAX protease family)
MNESRHKPVASYRHTAILLGILAAVSYVGAKTLHTNSEQNSRISIYLGVLISEWALFYYVLVGIRSTGTALKDLLGEPWGSARKFIVGLLVSALFFFVSNYAIVFASDYLHLRPEGAGTLLPITRWEGAVFILVSVSAGICEEIVYRGYLQRQFRAMTRSATLAILIQALVFGFSHGYQGFDSMLRITIYGALAGLTAKLTRSLMPTIVSHAWQDLFSGVLARWSSIQ